MSENNSFSEKHPKISLLLGFLIIFFSFICFVFGCIRIINLIADFMIRITSIASTLDVVVIVALITGAVSIVTVVLSSIVAKWLEYKHARREYLTQKREGPYGDFVEMIYRVQQTSANKDAYPREEMVEDLMRFSKQITLWGSPTVVNDWVKFKENALKNKDGFGNLMLTDKLMNDMRKDLGLKRVKEGNLLAFFVNDIKETMEKEKNKQKK